MGPRNTCGEICALPPNLLKQRTKAKTKQPNAELISALASHYQCSTAEAKEYKQLLAKADIVRILTHRGNDDKTIKKLLK